MAEIFYAHLHFPAHGSVGACQRGRDAARERKQIYDVRGAGLPFLPSYLQVEAYVARGRRKAREGGVSAGSEKRRKGHL